MFPLHLNRTNPWTGEALRQMWLEEANQPEHPDEVEVDEVEDYDRGWSLGSDVADRVCDERVKLIREAGYQEPFPALSFSVSQT